VAELLFHDDVALDLVIFRCRRALAEVLIVLAMDHDSTSTILT
jgi:hypothetical protein